MLLPRCSARSERERIQEDRRLLPIYPYRDELLKAIEEHQVAGWGVAHARTYTPCALARTRMHTNIHSLSRMRTHHGGQRAALLGMAG